LAVRATERLPRPRLLACDIDGTILDGRGQLRPVVRDAITAIAASGVEVILATGRSPWSGIADLAARLGLDGPQVTMQGALVSSPGSGTIHRLRALPPRTYVDALRFADELGIDPIVALLDGHRAERIVDGAALFTTPFIEGDGFHYVAGLERLVDQRPLRVFLPTGGGRHRAVREAAAERFAGMASLVWTDTSGVEFLAPGTNKGEAVAWLAEARGIPLDEVAAVGDAMNDTEMLRAAGRSAAMGSAPAEVRAAADIVVPDSSDDGVVDAFSWFFPDLADTLGARSGRGPRLLVA
jgi:hydroxymethylpyrimidine pyrophosphatase-like HAD family hydrolase